MRSVLWVLRALIALSTTIEVYLVATYAFRYKSSLQFSHRSLTLAKWLFVGMQDSSLASVCHIGYAGLNEIEAGNWQRRDSIIHISYYSEKVNSLKFQYSFLMASLNLIAAYDLNVRFI